MSGWRSTDTPEQSAEEDERLLNLFWNRAELKKEFSNLRHDRDHLVEKVKEQEKKTDKVRLQLQQLEALLADPSSGFKAIVYFQLQALWATCHKQLLKFSEELKKQQQDRERKRQIMEFNQDRQKRLHDVSGRIVSVKAEADDMKLVIAELVARFDRLTGFWNYFKRRDAQRVIDEHKERLAEIRARLEELFDRRIKIESEPWPDYSGLTTSGKRAINLAMIALAQHLFVNLNENAVATHARTVRIKKVEEVSYGTKSDCEYLMKKIIQLTEAMLADRNYGDELKARTDMLSKQVEYKNDKETIPVANTLSKLVSSVPGFDPTRTVASVPMDVNVLTDDYWDLNSVLMR